MFSKNLSSLQTSVEVLLGGLGGCGVFFSLQGSASKNPTSVTNFVDVEGTKAVKRMINLLAITVNLYHEIDADPSGSGSKTDRVRK